MASVATASQELSKSHLVIKGPCSLSGQLKVSGAKNSALVLMTAALLTEEPIRIKNVPELTDIEGMVNILLAMGVNLKRGAGEVQIHAKTLHHVELPYELVHGLRARFFCIGPLIARLGKAKIRIFRRLLITFYPASSSFEFVLGLDIKLNGYRKTKKPITPVSGEYADRTSDMGRGLFRHGNWRDPPKPGRQQRLPANAD